MEQRQLSLAAFGCSGPIARIFVDGFLREGVSLRLLARDAAGVARRYPDAEVVGGSMMNAGDVARAMQGVDAGFLTTPMGLRNDPSVEIEAAKAVIAGAKAANLPHLIYVSVLGADHPRGVGILDAKYEIERLLAASGVPFSILRCGSYMEDVFDARIGLLNRGKFLFPVTKSRRFSYTSQRDVAPFVVQVLLKERRILYGHVNFVIPDTYSVSEVENILSMSSGISIRAANKFPTYFMFLALTPYFNWRRHRFSSIIPLIRYFDRNGYTATKDTVAELFPAFKMTPLDEHLGALFAASGRPAELGPS